MADTLALEHLFNEVLARFAQDGTHVPNSFGWKEKAKHGANNRIVWYPGKPGDGEAGKHAPASKQPINPRSVATLLEVFTCEIQGYDANATDNEMAQYKATRLLYDAWFRAVYLAAYGTFTIETLNWDRTKTERQHGAMLVAVCTIQAMIPDAAFGTAPTDTKAELTTHLLSQTDPTVEVTHS